MIDKLNKLISIYNKSNKECNFYYHTRFDVLCCKIKEKKYALNDFNDIADSYWIKKQLDKQVKGLLKSAEAIEIIELDAKIQNLINETIAPYLLLKDL